METHTKDETETKVQGSSDADNAGYSPMRYRYNRPISLCEAISCLFDGQPLPPLLPRGIKSMERATVEALRIEFEDEVDEELLSQIAKEEGYSVEREGFPTRITKEGMIIARVGSKSDIGGRCSLFLYLFPSEMSEASVYLRILAEREGVMDNLGRISFERFYEFNLKVIRFADKYVIQRYPQ